MAATKKYFKPSNFQPTGNSTRVIGRIEFRRPDDSVDSALTFEKSAEVLLPHILSAEARDANSYIGSRSSAHFGPFGLKVVDPPPAIPMKLIEFPSVRSNNKKRWLASKKTLDIVVSDFATCSVKLMYEYGEKDRRWLSSTAIERGPVESGLFPAGSMPGRVNIGGYTNCTGFRFYSPYDQIKANISSSPFEDGWSDHELKMFIQSALYTSSIDSELVTETLAEANTGMVDLLTTLAEAPETFISIFNGCRTILSMYKDARKRDIRILNKVKIRRLELARLNARSWSEFNGIKEMEKHLQQVRSIEKSIKDLIDAIAGVWLTYRLEIYPTVKTIEAALEAKDMLDRGFFRSRETRVMEHPVPTIQGFKPNRSSIPLKHRCFIKRGASSADAFDLLFTTNPFLTAWELVPLSFVLDRYVSIGSLLAAFFGNPKSPSVTEGSTYSWQVKESVSFEHPDTKSRVTAEIAMYRRVVIDPNSFVCIPFPASRSRDQHLDHLALAWKLLLKNLWKV